MAAGPRRRRVVLLFAVLAGLFLMHGLSAPSMHCMPMPTSSHSDSAMTGMSAVSDVSAPAAMPATSAVPAMSATSAQTVPATTVSDADPTTDHMAASETCVPLRPEGMSGLFLALFLIVITLWLPRLPYAPRLIRPHWPHGPPRTGVDILRTLSISRT